MYYLVFVWNGNLFKNMLEYYSGYNHKGFIRFYVCRIIWPDHVAHLFCLFRHRIFEQNIMGTQKMNILQTDLPVDEDIKQACQSVNLSVYRAAKATDIPSTTIYSWTAPKASTHGRKPLSVSVAGFKVLLALSVSKDGVFIDKLGEVTIK